MCLPEANLRSALLLMCSARRWSPGKWAAMMELTCPNKLPQEVEHSLKNMQTASFKTHPWHTFTHDFMTHGVHTWFSSLLSLNQVVCFRKTLFVCFIFDCVGVNASEWACGPTHVGVSSIKMHTLSLRVLQSNLKTSNKNLSWLHHIDHFTSSALFVIGNAGHYNADCIGEGV